jgi:hypothetical protein
VSLVIENGRPQRVDIANEKSQFAIRYLSYEMLSETTLERFARPENVTYTDAKEP